MNFAYFLATQSSVVSVDQYLNMPSDEARVVLKHDVKHDIDLAVVLGEIEAKTENFSTFDFQFNIAISSPIKVIKLQEFGHDIRVTNLASLLHNADLIITHEGQIDEQTAYNKAPTAAAKLAQKTDIPVLSINPKTGNNYQKVFDLGITQIIIKKTAHPRFKGYRSVNKSPFLKNQWYWVIQKRINKI